MSIIDNPKLYEKVKRIADLKYNVNSAFKSGYVVMLYKKLGGGYSGENKNSNTGLTRWFQEKWKDIGDKKYPVFRPTIKIDSKTPLLVDEIDPINLKSQILLKQKYKNTKNLPKFEKKKGIYKISQYALNKSKDLGLQLKLSKYKNKKIDIYKNNQYICSIGDIDFKDYQMYLSENNKEFADNRRRLFKLRNHKYINNVGSCAYYSNLLLW